MTDANDIYVEAARWTTESLHEVWSNKALVAGREFSIMLPDGVCSAEIFVMTPDMASKIKKMIQEDVAGDDSYVVDNPVD